MDLFLKDFRRFEKNTLQGFCTFEILDIHLVIKDCTIHQKNGKAWIGFPARPYKNKEGVETWTNLIEFSDDVFKEEFRMKAVAAIKKHIETQKLIESRPKNDKRDPF